MLGCLARIILCCAARDGRAFSIKNRPHAAGECDSCRIRPVESGVVTTIPAAVLWDMDGTIIDTEPFWMEAETDLVHSYGGTWTHEDALTLVGQGLWHSARMLQSRGVALGEDEIIGRLTGIVVDRVVADGLPWRPGARELLKELRLAGIPTALVTMSIRRLATMVDEAIEFDAFDFVVAGDDVTHAKPHPEAYLRAAQLLEVNPADCVAIEDSSPGVAAAVASGAATIGVPLNVALLDDGSFTVWETLAGRTVEDLGGVLAARSAVRNSTPSRATHD
jgi:HAD superfamily hydrolase (TIGR01509 family)